MTDRQSTHSHDCWVWGPKHYECAVRQVEQLASELQEWRNRAQDKTRLWRQAMDELDAAQAEARELRAELARVRELAAKWRAAPQNPDEPLLAMAADELEAALSRPAEQHDPLAVSDHCGECGEPEPECACDERESLPLMARRSWMRRDTDYFVVHGDFCLEIKALNGRAPYFDESGELVVCAEAGDSIERDQVDAEAQPDGIYSIADTDGHGLKVIPRTADMPEDVTHMTLHTRRFFRAGELRARSVEGDEGLVRIEDYRPAAEQPAAPAPELPLVACPGYYGSGIGGYHSHGPREEDQEGLRCEQGDGFERVEHAQGGQEGQA